ncbi:MAG: porin family protein [candidate division KSB1 bacterium]|nr:porin family protein [candidate division KSB1 bacterium]
MKRIALIVCSVILTGLGLAEAKSSGAYFGGGVGQSYVKTDLGELENTDLKLDESGFAYKIYAGVLTGRSLALEGGYRSFGTVKSKAGDIKYESNITAYDLHALGRVDLALVELFAKAGYSFWDQQNNITARESNKGGSNFSWGIGAVAKLGGLGVRAEWERFETKSFDRLSMLTLSVVFGM